MNPLNTITGTIIAGFVLAIILGPTVKVVTKSSATGSTDQKTKLEKSK